MPFASQARINFLINIGSWVHWILLVRMALGAQKQFGQGWCAFAAIGGRKEAFGSQD